MIYFVRQGSHGPIKIGYSAEPIRRVKELRTGSPAPLFILTTVPGERTDELAIHRRLRRYRGEGEWFAHDTEVFSVIAELENVEYEVVEGRAFAVLRRKDLKSPTHKCAFCGRMHKHGEGDGHRLAHCKHVVRSEVLAADGTILFVQHGYIVRTGARTAVRANPAIRSQH